MIPLSLSYNNKKKHTGNNIELFDDTVLTIGAYVNSSVDAKNQNSCD